MAKRTLKSALGNVFESPKAGDIIEKLKNFSAGGRVVVADGQHSVDRGDRDQK